MSRPIAPIRAVARAVRRFHRDEEGDALQVIMIVALACLILVALKAFGGQLLQKIAQAIQNLMSDYPA